METIILVLIILLVMGILMALVVDWLYWRGYRRGTGWQRAIKDIAAIHISHNSFGRVEAEYKFDLKNKHFEKRCLDDGEHDNYLGDEEFILVRNLEDEEIAEFLRKLAEHGMTVWKNSYVNETVADVHQWSITIIFSNGTRQYILGKNKYPETWDKMNEAFKKLTEEENILPRHVWQH